MQQNLSIICLLYVKKQGKQYNNNKHPIVSNYILSIQVSPIIAGFCHHLQGNTARSEWEKQQSRQIGITRCKNIIVVTNYCVSAQLGTAKSYRPQALSDLLPENGRKYSPRESFNCA